MSERLGCFKLTLTSGVTKTSTYVDMGSSFRRVYLEIPSKDNADLYILAASDINSIAAGDFKRVVRDQLNTATVHADFMIGSAVTSRIVPIPVDGLRYLKVESSSAISGDVNFKFFCGD